MAPPGPELEAGLPGQLGLRLDADGHDRHLGLDARRLRHGA